MKTFLMLAALGVPLCAAAAETGVTVIQKGRAFRPAEITISSGTTVTFTNDDAYLHQIYVNGLFDSEEKAPGENLNETFPQAGTFQVRCHIHPTMKMAVHVK